MENFKGTNQAFQVTDPHYGEFVVDFNDVIFRHQKEQFDHLRWHEMDEDKNLSMSLLFLGRVALDSLAKAGVPEAYLDLPTPTIVATYTQDQINRLEMEFDD